MHAFTVGAGSSPKISVYVERSSRVLPAKFDIGTVTITPYKRLKKTSKYNRGYFNSVHSIHICTTTVVEGSCWVVANELDVFVRHLCTP